MFVEDAIHVLCMYVQMAPMFQDPRTVSLWVIIRNGKENAENLSCSLLRSRPQNILNNPDYPVITAVQLYLQPCTDAHPTWTPPLQPKSLNVIYIEVILLLQRLVSRGTEFLGKDPGCLNVVLPQFQAPHN